MLDFITERWFIEAVTYIVSAFIIVYALCWLFEQVEKK
jgi:hypothetical protein